jgi:hypothetical protein
VQGAGLPGHGLKPKDLVGIPWRVAFALQADGWWLRSDVIWAKPNPMPESITDRPTKAHEYLFLLTKRATYFYDSDAAREPHAVAHIQQQLSPPKDRGESRQFAKQGLHDFVNPAGRNRRSVWTIATQSYDGAHFATFPQALVEPCILAGTSERGACPVCGAPWRRVVERERVEDRPGRVQGRNGDSVEQAHGADGGVGDRCRVQATTTGWTPTCPHDAAPVPCVVLDPFSGSGTVPSVAQRLGRVGIGVELKADYLALAQRRIGAQGVLL